MIVQLHSKIPFGIVLNSKNPIIRMQCYNHGYFAESQNYFAQFIIFNCKIDQHFNTCNYKHFISYAFVYPIFKFSPI